MFGKNKSHDMKDKSHLEDSPEQNPEGINEVEDADNTSAETSPETDLLEKEKQKSAELHDKYLRLSAEFENFRRRTNKEKAELIQFGNRDLLLQVLPVFDDFERAREVAAKAEDKAAILEGLELIFKKFKNFLDSTGLKEINAKGEPFDSDLHDAIVTIPAPSEDLKGKVVDEIQKGYKLNDKVLRHSKVVVGE